MRLFLSGFLILSLALSGLPGAALAQTENCEETWEVDKTALQKVFQDMDRHLRGPEPVVINLKELGATSGQLIIVFAKQNLRCAKQVYEPQLTGSGTIRICKRPEC